MPKGKRWSEQEKQVVFGGRAEGKKWREIAAALPGRSVSNCASLFANRHRANYYASNHADRRRVSVPPDRIAEREQRTRQRLERSDVTAILMGDPLPGRSALDRRATASPRVSLPGGPP